MTEGRKYLRERDAARREMRRLPLSQIDAETLFVNVKRILGTLKGFPNLICYRKHWNLMWTHTVRRKIQYIAITQSQSDDSAIL